ncbi:hypothetical protein JQN72_10720 [Phycicoccus sp. CSK15P-2]|uniref:hypothetical protein n=1 Tax=Phycicoccus sp. CSK15P-2 TaxID=2807627 RepID=UPI0019510B87|nr:hypothetical protein [Phycicoccus sp. CSK15P-2]MBM6404714.1 hypothetical protein [Phycicoccus sp. CSK15P-2]
MRSRSAGPDVGELPGEVDECVLRCGHVVPRGVEPVVLDHRRQHPAATPGVVGRPRVGGPERAAGLVEPARGAPSGRESLPDLAGVRLDGRQVVEDGLELGGGPRRADGVRVCLGGALPTAGRVTEPSELLLGLLATLVQVGDPGGGRLECVARGNLLRPLTVELAGAGAPERGQERGQPHPLQTADVVLLEAVPAPDPLQLGAGVTRLTVQRGDQGAQAYRLAVVGGRCVERGPGGREVVHGPWRK